ncbi:MAG: phytoene/squalene synthase family protein [Kibdelosporangium sp.]
MTSGELDAAGIADPRLRAAYARCRSLNAQHGRTYFLATRLLAPEQRPAVHALYGFARYVDDVVDMPAPNATIDDIGRRIDDAEEHMTAGRRRGTSDHPVIAAVVDTAHRYHIADELFTAFFDSMRMDLSIRDYPSRTDLAKYVYGSARVVGLQMLPVLGAVDDIQDAAPPAAALGEAFQLTNFLRDVGEDLHRDRVYLPADELAAFNVDRERLTWCRDRGRADAPVRRALAEQVAITRAVYREAAPGIAMLRPVSRPCIGTAFTLYAEILDRIQEMDYNVFAARPVVGNARRVRVAIPAFLAAMRHRRSLGRGSPDEQSAGKDPTR